MTSRKSIKVVAITAVSMIVTTLSVVTLNNSGFENLYQKADATVNVTTEHSLLLNEDWGYAGESTKVKRSNEDNDFTIAFSDNSKFGNAGSGLAFTTTEDGLYISTSTLLNGISQVYVKGSSSNGKNGVNVYGHFYRQTLLVNDSETVNGELNSLISFAPTNYVAIEFKGIDSIEYVEIGYSCLEATDPYDYMMSGGQNTDGNGLFQSMTGLKTTLPVGTNVEVQMDVAVTGTFDIASCELYWVDQVWSTAGGESDKARTDIKSTIVTGESGWHHVTFTATVRNFPNLRFNTKYVTQDTSEFGNAVYLIGITHGTLDSFNYKNVTITPKYYSMVSGGNNGSADIYYQSTGGLSVDYSVGTVVSVEMDIYVTGTFNQYSGIYWLNSVYSNNLWNNAPSIMSGTDAAASAGSWQHISFVATVRNFASCGIFAAVDTSAYGNAVYLISRQKTENAFNYKNVAIQQITAAPEAQKDSSGNYYTSYIGFTANGFAEGADVHVSLDIYYTGGIDSYTAVYALDKSVIQWGGGAYADGLNQVKVIEAGAAFPTSGFTKYEFDTKVYTHSNAIHWGASGATFDVSTYGICVLLCFKNATNSTSPAAFRNVVITAK